jgi:biopolymer transport protein ExbB
MYYLYDAIEMIRRFMEAGGQVLWGVAIATFLLWALAFERFLYFNFQMRRDIDAVIGIWEARPERKSWAAHAIRAKMISEMREKIFANLPMIKTLVACCPLLGLLGTVTGMVEVFNILAVTGGADAKSMAGGVSRATIPTMAGMVAAIAGVFANTVISRIAAREAELLEDHLTADH